MSNAIRPLADAELAVMRLLWEAGRLTARDIREHLYPDGSASSHGTVQKLLQRLEAKGYVERDRGQFVHQFQAKVKQADYAGSQLESLAEKLAGGSLVPFMTHLMEKQKISVKERQQLRDLLDQ